MKRQIRWGVIRRILTAVFVLPLLLFGKGSVNNNSNAPVEWKPLENGLDYAEVNGPHVSKYSDSKVSILKINPAYFDFCLVAATEYDSTQKTIKEWCDMKGLTAAINAGMYSLKDHYSASGYMQNFNHINNPVIKKDFNAMAVFNPQNKALPAFQIVDMKNQDWSPIKKDYNCCFQSIRMIDNKQQGIYWKKKPVLKCSMTVLATDKSGNVIFLFARSPYNANEMIGFLLKSNLNIQTAMYLEGGPEACMYIKTNGNEILKFGSYVSYSCPNDDNVEVRTLPNILGIKKKILN
jgi:hypothetical protein